MSGVLHTAAQRLNTSVAGLTGQPSDPSQEPGARAPASAVEVANLLPTEFGGLSHLFGGEAQPSQQYAPVNPGLEIPAGSVRGHLGGLAPDVRNTATHATEAAKAQAAKVLPPVSAAAANAVAKARAWLKI